MQKSERVFFIGVKDDTIDHKVLEQPLTKYKDGKMSVQVDRRPFANSEMQNPNTCKAKIIHAKNL